MSKAKPEQPQPEPDAGKEPVNARVDVALMERARNAVWTLGRGRTLSGLVTEGLERVVAELEREHNGGKPFPTRESELPKSGRKKKPKPT